MTNKIILIVYIWLLSIRYVYLKLSISKIDQERAVTDLIYRIIGEKANLFYVTIRDNNTSSTDEFTLQKKNDRVLINATNGVSAAYAFHYYLKNYCKCHISWDYDNIKLPKQLPYVEEYVKSYDRFRYYQNVCTYSYSYVWWAWPRWERELDWMALNGINLALAFTGQEAIWLRVYKMLNMTDLEINEHFAGPAFMAWQRMGNLRGYAGSLSLPWHIQSLILQHRIIERMNELGIIPVLPAFCGFVPRAFKRLFPNAKLTETSAWCNLPDKFCCPYILHPDDPLYQNVGEMFMNEIVTEFGSTHFYNCDTFNENHSPNVNDEYLRKTAKATFNVMQSIDSNAIWLLQGWMFANKEQFWTPERTQMYLSSVPNDRMIILDLHSELRPQYTRLKSYYGKPFIWCMLHNFGGTLGMHGAFDLINQNVISARYMENSSMIGTGLTMEGINQNYVIYDFMSESSWRDHPVDKNNWIQRYSRRRYGFYSTKLNTAWKLLANSVYNYKKSKSIHGQYTICVRPNLNISIPQLWYNISHIAHAWDLFVNTLDTKNIRNVVSPNYLYDLVDLSRQILQVLFDQLYMKFVESVQKYELKSFRKYSFLMLELLKDLDVILATDSHFMLGNWLYQIQMITTVKDELKLFEMNARLQITLWALQEENELADYATKQWSGIVKDYYRLRWKLFFRHVYASLIKEQKFNREKYNKSVYKNVEKKFIYSRKSYPSKPTNSTKLITKMLYSKWRHRLEC